MSPLPKSKRSGFDKWFDRIVLGSIFLQKNKQKNVQLYVLYTKPPCDLLSHKSSLLCSSFTCRSFSWKGSDSVEVLDILAEDGGADSEGRWVGRGTPVTSVEGPDTGLWTAKDEVMQDKIFRCTFFISRHEWCVLHSREDGSFIFKN